MNNESLSGMISSEDEELFQKRVSMATQSGKQKMAKTHTHKMALIKALDFGIA